MENFEFMYTENIQNLNYDLEKIEMTLKLEYNTIVSKYE